MSVLQVLESLANLACASLWSEGWFFRFQPSSNLGFWRWSFLFPSSKPFFVYSTSNQIFL